MWNLSNETPFAAERIIAGDRNGSDAWLVAVKGTFMIRPDGTTEIAEEQEEITLFPKHLGDPSSSSLLYESDLDYTKPATDVILHGHAYAPKGKLATILDLAMKVGDIHKTLRVFGDRHWDIGLLGMKMTPPAPFEKIPVIYERAFGGAELRLEDPGKRSWEPRNPVGTGFAVKGEHLIGRRVANIEYPLELIKSWKDRPRPAGFGPIARHWSPRVKLAGTYDERWKKEKFPLLPHDFDERFFQCAPADQRIQGYLRGNEMVELINLSPNGLLRFSLPRVALGFSTILAGKTVHHRADLHSVIIEPDIPRVMMVWHSMLPCHGKKHTLEETKVFQKKVI